MKIASGYIALLSTIIISLTLLVISVAASAGGFAVRHSETEQQVKRASVALAESCVQVALLKFARNDSLVSNQVIPVGTEFCTIVSMEVVSQSAQKRLIINTKADSGGAAYTQIRVEFVHNTTSNAYALISWVETP